MAYISKITLPDNNGTYDLKDTNAVHSEDVSNASVTIYSNNVNAWTSTTITRLGDANLEDTNRYSYIPIEQGTDHDYCLDLGTVIVGITPSTTSVPETSGSSSIQVAQIATNE